MTVPAEKWKEYQNDIVKFVNDLVYIPKREGVTKVSLKGPWKYQADVIREATKKRSNGKNRYSVIAICIPKQNGKTFMASLILAWKLCTHFNINGIVASNSKDQATSVVFDTFKDIMRYSPELCRLIGESNILDKEVRYPAFNSRITVLSSSKAAAWGYGIDIGVVDEIHAAPDDEGRFQILASQTGPRDGQVILPSQVSSQLNILYKLYQVYERKEDPSLYFYYLSGTNPSPLVTDRWLNSRKSQLTDLQYDLYHKNDWVSSTQKLFHPEKIGEAVEKGSCYRVPVNPDDLQKWEYDLGTKFMIGGGLDRAFPYSRHGDRTVWTVVAKGMVDGDECWIILDQRIIPNSDEMLIKDAIHDANKWYRLSNVVLESFGASDIHQWCLDKGIEAELIHAVDKNQIQSFNKFYHIVEDGQLRIPEGLPTELMLYDVKRGKGSKDVHTPILVKELREFEQDSSRGVPKFGHKPGAMYHDDTVYSLNWAIHALREKQVYERKRRPAWRAAARGFGVGSGINPFTGR